MYVLQKVGSWPGFVLMLTLHHKLEIHLVLKVQFLSENDLKKLGSQRKDCVLLMIISSFE